MKPWMKLVCAGWIMGSATRSLQEDAIGQRGYMRLIEDAWVSAWVSVPLAIVILVLALVMMEKAKREINP